MPFTVVRTEEVTPEELQRFQQDEEDYEWLSAHAQEIEGQYKGKFIAVVNRQLFAGSEQLRKNHPIDYEANLCS